MLVYRRDGGLIPKKLRQHNIPLDLSLPDLDVGELPPKAIHPPDDRSGAIALSRALLCLAPDSYLDIAEPRRKHYLLSLQIANPQNKGPPIANRSLSLLALLRGGMCRKIDLITTSTLGAEMTRLRRGR